MTHATTSGQGLRQVLYLQNGTNDDLIRLSSRRYPVLSTGEWIEIIGTEVVLVPLVCLPIAVRLWLTTKAM